MNNIVKQNLNNLYNSSYNFINSFDLQDLLKNKKSFDMDLGFITNLFDDEELKNLRKALKNPSFILAIENAKSVNMNDFEIVEKLVLDIKSSISLLTEEVIRKNTQIKNQIIFLDYDYGYQACFCGFGEGNYPILSKPEYVSYNYNNELYNGVGNIDLSGIFDNLTKLNELIEELEIYDLVTDSDLYHQLNKAYQHKACILLNDAFSHLGQQIFNHANITRPLYVYLNEHDCEAMNVFILD